MNILLTQLETLIHDLKNINDNILYGINSITTTIQLERQRSVYIYEIDIQCKKIKINLTNDNRTIFIDLIKKYIIIQNNYRNNKKEQCQLQAVICDSNLSLNNIVINNLSLGKSEIARKSAGFLANETYNYVVDKHKDILKLEHGLDELKELFIAMNAITEEQGNKLDKISEHVRSGRSDCEMSKNELITAKKIKKSKWYCL